MSSVMVVIRKIDVIDNGDGETARGLTLSSVLAARLTANQCRVVEAEAKPAQAVIDNTAIVRGLI